jgi:hypothetical protein
MHSFWIKCKIQALRRTYIQKRFVREMCIKTYIHMVKIAFK